VWSRGEECLWDWRGVWRERIGVVGEEWVFVPCLSDVFALVYSHCKV